MNKKSLLVLVFIFTCGSVVFAKKPPTMPNSYDSVGISARSIAMGYSGVAMPSCLDGIFYNSASLGFNTSEKIQVEVLTSVMRNTDLNDNDLVYSNPVDLGFTSFVVNQKQGAISWRTFSSNKIEINDGSDFYKKDEHIKALTVSVANLNEAGVSFGLNLSYLYGTIAESSINNEVPFAQTSSGNGFTMDLGIMAPVKGNLYAGINLENVFGIMWWENYDFDQLPFGIRAGLGYITNTFNLVADYNKKFYRFGDIENDNTYSVGIEQYVGDILVLRAGLQGALVSEQKNLKYTYGAGINISIVSLSLAAENYKINDESISQYSVSLKVLI